MRVAKTRGSADIMEKASGALAAVELTLQVPVHVTRAPRCTAAWPHPKVSIGGEPFPAFCTPAAIQMTVAVPEDTAQAAPGAATSHDGPTAATAAAFAKLAAAPPAPSAIEAVVPGSFCADLWGSVAGPGGIFRWGRGCSVRV